MGADMAGSRIGRIAGGIDVVTIECPWCAEEEALPLAAVQAHEASFTCPDCGTSVSFVEDPEVVEAAA